MSLARVKTWVAAEVLFASDLNAEFNNILNNAMSLISPLTSAVSADGNDITALDELAFNDAGGNASAAGRLRRNSTNITWHDGTAARRLAAMDTSNNFGLGTYSFGTNAASALALPNGTAPASSPADLVQLYAGDQAAGKSSLIIRTEDGSIHHLGSNVGIGQASFGTNADNVLAIGAGTAPTTFPADAVQAMVKDAGVGGTAAFWLYDEIGGNMRLGSTTTTDNGFSITSQSGVSFLARTGSGEVVWQSTSPMAFRGTASALRVFFDDSGNVGTGGISAFGTSAANLLGIGSGTAPSTAPADMVQIWVADRNGAGTAAPYIRTEDSGITERLSALTIQSFDGTERTCTNSATDLSTHTVNIPALDAFIVTGLYKKTAHASTASLGLKVNTVQTINNFAVTSADAEVEQGAFCFGVEHVFGAARDTNYTQSGIFTARSDVAGGSIDAFSSSTYANQLPTAAITEIIVTGVTGNASNTLAIKNVTVYRLARN